MFRTLEIGVIFVCAYLTLTAAFALQSSAEVSLEDAAGIWLFDEGKGDAAKDSSGNGNDGKLINGPSWVDGKYGSALEFDGSNTSVETEHDDSLNFGEKNFTAVAWFKTDNPGGFIISKTVKNGGWLGFEVKFSGNAIRTCLQNDPKSTTVCDNRGSGIGDGKWHHVAAVFNRDKGERWIYIDGEQQDGPIDQGAVKGSINNENGVAIGVSMGDHRAGSFFNGVIDEVALFKAELDEKDLETVMNGLESLLPVSPSGNLATTWGEVKQASQ